MKRVTAMFTDRPQTPLETALWWTDFVIRHSKDDLATLRPLNVGEFWWKRRQLDVWATIFTFVTTVLSLSIYMLYILVKCTCRKARTSAGETTEKATRMKKIQ